MGNTYSLIIPFIFLLFSRSGASYCGAAAPELPRSCCCRRVPSLHITARSASGRGLTCGQVLSCTATSALPVLGMPVTWMKKVAKIKEIEEKLLRF